MSFPVFAAWFTQWTNSYFVATFGGATLGIIKRYVANPRNV
jgi:REP element-mobilizing transposase RayT